MSGPTDGAIASITASVSARDATVVEGIRRTLERIRAASDLNAFTHIDETAIGRAERLDADLAAGGPIGPMVGVAVAIKDLIDHAGRPNTLGTSGAPSIPSRSAPAIERLEQAGAVVVGRTGLHEVAFGFSSENHWFGPVRNPWNRDLSPGGSSGGSGAAVAAGLVPAALGTDTGGSVRVPAALCGVVGLKVTHGRIPVRGVYPLAPTLDTVGPLARSVADVAVIYEAIAGDDPEDPWSAPRPVAVPSGPADPERLTVGVPHPWIDGPLATDVAAAFTSAVERLRAVGVTVLDLQLSQLAPAGEIAPSVNFEVAAVHRRRFESDPEGYGPNVRERLAAAMETTPADYLEALAWRASARHAAERAFERCDLLVTPTVATTRKRIGEDLVDLDGTEAHYRSALSRFTAPVNHVGLPALALPLEGDSTPPPSIQLIAPAWSEARLIAAGLLLEGLGISESRRPPAWFD